MKRTIDYEANSYVHSKMFGSIVTKLS